MCAYSVTSWYTVCFVVWFICVANIPLEPNDHETMVVPPQKKSRTTVYSGKKRPKCTKGTSLYQLCATSCACK